MIKDDARTFLPTLRQLERRLPLPIPQRVRLLRELEWDLEEIHEGFMAQGLDPREARARALQTLVPDEASLRELGKLHRPLYRRFTRNLARDGITRMERGALALMTVVVVGVEASALLHTEILRSPSPFLWPVLGWATLLFVLFGAKAFELWVKGDHRDLGRGLAALLGLVVITLGTGVFGVLADTSEFLARLEEDPEAAGILILPWLIRECTLLSMSILLSLAGGLCWWGMAHWVSLVSGARQEVLGQLDLPDTQASRR